MPKQNVVSREEWLVARKEHLSKEKEFTRLRDQLSEDRRNLPRVRLEKDYVFDTPNGKQKLADLFEGRSQLLVSHFMFDPAWDEGCKSCSFMADHYSGTTVHLDHRDVTLVAVSSAALEKLEAYKRRMGWNFRWVSSGGGDFNRDYHVTFTEEDKEKGEVFYNFGKSPYFSAEAPGVSVFMRDEDGAVFHTYSCYGRGLDLLIGAYNLLDLVPKGRDEADLPHTMAWIRHHDKYGD